MTTTLGPRNARVLDFAGLVARCAAQPPILKIGGLALAYFVAARLGFVFTLVNGSAPPIWHPAGLGVAALVICGDALWPGIVVGELLASLTSGASPAAASFAAAGSTLEVLAAVELLRRTGFRARLDRLIDVPLLGLAAAVAGFVGASIGVLGLALGGDLATAGVPLAWSTRAAADAVSVLLVGGLLLAWSAPSEDDLLYRRPLESLIALAIVTGTSFVLFFDVFDLRARGESVAFPIIPLLVWVAFRIGPRGTALAAALFSVIAIAATDRGLGPFVGATRGDSLFYLVVFIALTTVTGEAVAAVVAEREASVAGMRSATLALAQERESLAARAATFQRLLAYAERISGLLAEPELYALCVEALDAVVPADLVGLAVRDRSSGAFIVRAEQGSAGAVGRPIQVGEGPAGCAIRDRRLVRFEPYARAAYPAALRDLNAADTYAIAIGVPLTRDDTVLGALTVGRIAPEAPFSELELEALALLAEVIGLAVSNALLHSDVADLAIHDALTGLHNRRYFDAAVEQLFAMRARTPPEQRTPLSLILFDLDRFGDFNLQHGHQVGDEVLRVFAAILRGRLRSADLVARYGGEEFVAILPGAGQEDARRIADGVRQTLAGTTISGIDGTPLSVTVSAGCASASDENLTGDGLLRVADVGLLMAKRSGRNRVVAA